MLGAMKLIASIITALVASLFTANISFADQKPIKDRKGASRLQPKSGSFDDMEAAKRVVLPAPRKAHNWEPHLSMHVRLVGIPNEIMGIFFEEHQPYIHGSAGLGVDLGDPRSELVTIELDWTGMSFPDSNWLEVGAGPSSAKFSQIDLHMLSLDATYKTIIPIVDALDFYVGGGLGLAGLLGTAQTTEVLPICTEPIANCQHWRNVSKADLDLPTRVIPVVHVTTGLKLEFEGFRARLDMGFKNLFYVGLSAGLDL
tara:strand:+ start:145 stop:915 length:771 start_codon:yes stop_codon:yes gene_type:complete